MRKLLIVAIFMLLDIVISPLRALGSLSIYNLYNLIAPVIASMLTIFLINKFNQNVKSYSVMSYAILGLVLVNLPFVILYFTVTSVSLYGSLMMICGVVVGFLFSTSKTRNSRYVVIIVSVIVLLLASSIGLDLWKTYVSNPLLASKGY